MTATEKEPVAALNIGDKCQVQWRDGSQQLEAVVLERRPVGHRKRRKEALAVDLRNLPADQMEYYVHYTHHDRRLDEWVLLEKFVLSTLERQQPPPPKESDAAAAAADLALMPSVSVDAGEDDEHDHTTSATNTQQQHSSSAAASDTPTAASAHIAMGGNWHGNSGDPALAVFEQEHEETTKVKNIEKMVMGEWEVEAWYYAPFPEEYSDIETLYVCEYCLTYMRKVHTYKHHKQTCPCRAPPGREIYRDPEEGLAVYEMDGQEHRVYCQKLCLLAKLFLDHKTLYYDPTPFFFYVITKVDDEGSHIVGYFSKEKVSSEGYNLACILTFPQFQKLSYGKFIISVSYELSKIEGKAGSPEKPLSDLGKVSYRSYWKYVLFNILAKHDPTDAQTDISIADMSAQTGIKMEDILSTLQALDMIKVWKGQHVVYVDQKVLQEYMIQK